MYFDRYIRLDVALLEFLNCSQGVISNLQIIIMNLLRSYQITFPFTHFLYPLVLPERYLNAFLSVTLYKLYSLT